jgi:PAB1-binding protein PBP1
MPEPEDDQTMFALEETGGSRWDQFEVNKRKFGVESTFDENLYTTRLDKGTCNIS